MSALGDLAVWAGLLGPPLLLTSGAVLLASRQPRWVLTAALALATVTAGAFVTFWYLWGKAFEYVDAYRPVPPRIDHVADLALAVSLTASLTMVGLVLARLLAARRSRPTDRP